MITKEIYNRQENMKLQIPDSCTVIGIGGVGSWVSLNLALSGVKKLILIDPDIIEITNLNRTPFCSRHVGKNKSSAMVELILERRIDANLEIFHDYVENVDIEDYIADVIIDCRDNIKKLPDEVIKRIKIIGGYDGNNITFHLNPSYKKVWGEEIVRYTVTPSWLVPPQLIANIITAFILFPIENTNREKEKVVNITINEILNKILI